MWPFFVNGGRPPLMTALVKGNAVVEVKSQRHLSQQNPDTMMLVKHNPSDTKWSQMRRGALCANKVELYDPEYNWICKGCTPPSLSTLSNVTNPIELQKLIDILKFPRQQQNQQLSQVESQQYRRPDWTSDWITRYPDPLKVAEVTPSEQDKVNMFTLWNVPVENTEEWIPLQSIGDTILSQGL
jgi:hypothetical protein